MINLCDGNLQKRVLTGLLAWFRLDSMEIIVLTGGIGSGKSVVAGMLKELGAGIIDSDRVGHEVLEKGTPGWQEVIDTFGREVLTAEEHIDRKKLAQIVFQDPESLRKLDKIIHPRIDQRVEARLQQYQKEGKKAVFIEMAILAEAPWMERVDRVWAVKTPREVALNRLKERGLSEPEALARIANQPSPESRIKKGLVIINNNGSLRDLRVKVEKLWDEIHNEDRK